jgi:hypothetical protein
MPLGGANRTAQTRADPDAGTVMTFVSLGTAQDRRPQGARSGRIESEDIRSSRRATEAHQRIEAEAIARGSIVGVRT